MFNYLTGNYDDSTGYVDAAPSLSWGGVGDTLTGLAQVWGGVEVAKSKQVTPVYQLGPNGQMYREGVPAVGAGGSFGGISPIMLLIIAGVAIFALKD